MLKQQEYETIRMYVANGHALHPEHAQALLVAFEDLHRAADIYLEDSGRVELSEVLYDDNGHQRIRLR